MLPSPTSACWVFSCFRNLQNSDMDYTMFNVCMWSFLCVRIHMTAIQHNMFDLEKLSQIVLVLLVGFEHLIFGSRVWRSTNWATPSCAGVTSTVIPDPLLSPPPFPLSHSSPWHDLDWELNKKIKSLSLSFLFSQPHYMSLMFIQLTDCQCKQKKMA